MLDLKVIKDNTQHVKERLAARGKDYSQDIDKVLELDTMRRSLIAETEQLKAKQNAITKQVPIMKKEGKNTDELFAEMKELSDKTKADSTIISEYDAEIEKILLSIPNTPHDSVVVGPDDSANVEQRRWGEPRKFDFDPLPHWELGSKLNVLDPERAANVTGARFHFYRGAGAKLERAIMNFYLDTHTDAGYTEIFPPFMVNRDSMKGTGQLPKFEEDAFKLANCDYFLIPTAEVPVTNMHKNEILSGDMLPIKYCAYSACFRAEAGSAGRDTRGLIRQHQFNKVELVGLPYRVVLLSTGDMGFSSAKTYDIEVWMPSYNRYVEISSCSNFEDYQARRANIKFREDAKSKPRYVHTLNGSGVALGRTTAAIMENYQNADGSITIPEVLRPYMRGAQIIKPE